MRAVLAGVLALAAAASVPAPADAGVTATEGLIIKASECSPKYHYEGSNVDTVAAAKYFPQGTVKFCVTKYKIRADDPAADYYMIYASSTWTLKSGQPSQAAAAYQYISSSRKARGHVFDATPSYTSSEECSNNFPVSLSLAGIGVTVNPKVCDSYRVKRTSKSPTTAAYTAAKVGGVRSMETAYVQKVAKGAKPVYTVTFWRPTYKHRWNGAQWVETSGNTKWTAID